MKSCVYVRVSLCSPAFERPAVTALAGMRPVMFPFTIIFRFKLWDLGRRRTASWFVECGDGESEMNSLLFVYIYFIHDMHVLRLFTFFPPKARY